MAGRDRISELPFEIINKILGLLVIEEVAGMAVLSTFWRGIWLSFTHLIFDARFLKHIEKKYSNAHSDIRTKNKKKEKRNNDIWTSAGLYVINKVLIQHNGFINKFVIDFSHTYRNTLRSRSFDFDQWLLFITHKGIEEISLSLKKEDEYCLPNCIFSCPSLRRLHICGVSYKPINTHCTLPNVTSLYFEDVNFDGGLLVEVPMLNSLSFIGCENVTGFNITAQKLDHLAIIDCPFYSINLDLAYCRCLELDSASLMDFVNEFTGKRELQLQLYALNVQHLKISHNKEYLESLDDDEQLMSDVSSAFINLIQICPHLWKLHINLTFSNILPKLPKLLDNVGGHGYKMLHVLELDEFTGVEYQVLFIKGLLACFPTLEKVVINDAKITGLYFDNNRVEEIVFKKRKQEILHFPRASTKAEIIFC